MLKEKFKYLTSIDFTINSHSPTFYPLDDQLIIGDIINEEQKNFC